MPSEIRELIKGLLTFIFHKMIFEFVSVLRQHHHLLKIQSAIPSIYSHCMKFAGELIIDLVSLNSNTEPKI